MRWSAIARVVVSLALLAGVAWWIDPAALGERLRTVEVPWLLTAIALHAAQTAISAWRWRYTAGRLGVGLGLPEALREYFVGNLLNQVLPGGVAGDAGRAWRHVRAGAPSGAAIQAVVLERAAGQLVMALLLIPSLVTLLTPAPPALVWGLATAVALALAVASHWLPPPPPAGSGIRTHLRRGLLARGVILVQAGSSILVVGAYLLAFLAAARALDVTLPAALLLPLVPPVLLAMLVPVTVAGWGLREGAAAAVWAVAGLAPADGAAIAVCYGVTALFAALPGALFLLPRRVT